MLEYHNHATKAFTTFEVNQLAYTLMTSTQSITWYTVISMHNYEGTLFQWLILYPFDVRDLVSRRLWAVTLWWSQQWFSSKEQLSSNLVVLGKIHVGRVSWCTHKKYEVNITFSYKETKQMQAKQVQSSPAQVLCTNHTILKTHLLTSEMTKRGGLFMMTSSPAAQY